MHSKRKQYTKEFKQNAVQMIVGTDLTIAQAARDLGINANMLYRWKVEEEKYGEKSFPGHGLPLEEELIRLRRENAALRQDGEILKKAVAIFSQHLP